MPRSAGTYSLPVNSWNPAVSGDPIDPAAWNATAADLAQALTDSIARDGQTNTTARIPFALGLSIPVGSASVPGLSMIGDSNTGVYSPSPDTVGLAAGGVAAFTASATAASVPGTFAAAGAGTFGGDITLSALRVVRQQTGAVLFTATPTAGATDSMVYDTSAVAVWDWRVNGTSRFRVTNTGAEVGGALAVSGAVTAGSFVGPLTGNASTATTLAANRNFSITGEVTAPAVAFNGAAPVALNTTLPNFVGMVAMFPGTAAPTGWLKANGQTVSRTTFAALWTYAQASGVLAASGAAKAANPILFGPGDGSTTFDLPDYRGLFPRAWDDGRGLYDAGRAAGSFQADEIKAHSHNWETFNTSGASGGNQSFATGNNTDVFTSNGVIQPTGGAETRPVNAPFLFCIKT